MKERYKFALVISIILILTLGYKYFHFKSEYKKSNISENKIVTECQTLSPHARPLGYPNDFPEGAFDEEVRLDFSKKQEIVKGNFFSKGKYGFRKKIVIKKETILTQRIVDNCLLKNYYYGIYRDKQLEQPIKEQSMKYILKVINEFEMGASIEDYPDFSDMIIEVLKPGTYYIAVYTNKVTDNFEAGYESWKAVPNTELSLEEGKYGYFFSKGGGQKIFFKIKVPSKGALYLSRRNYRFYYKAWLCDETRKVIDKAVLLPKNKTNKKYQRAKVSVPKAGAYYLMVDANYDEPRFWGAEIKYNFESE